MNSTNDLNELIYNENIYKICLFGEFNDEEIELIQNIINEHKDKFKNKYNDIIICNFDLLKTNVLLDSSMLVLNSIYCYCIYKFPKYNINQLFEHKAIFLHMLLFSTYTYTPPIIYIHTNKIENLFDNFLPPRFDDTEINFCNNFKIDLNKNVKQQNPSLESRLHEFFIHERF